MVKLYYVKPTTDQVSETRSYQWIIMPVRDTALVGETRPVHFRFGIRFRYCAPATSRKRQQGA